MKTKKSFISIFGLGKLLAYLCIVGLSFTPKVFADGPWTASAGFSSIQGGANPWFYQERPRAGGAVTNLNWNTGGSNVWWTSDLTGWIGTYQGVSDMHPGSVSDTIRKWVSPSGGTVVVTGRIYKMVLGGGGVVASVEKNGTSIWSKTLSGTDNIGYTTDADVGDVVVTTGDSISFVSRYNGSYGSDQTAWDPTITKVASYTAYTGLSSIQGANQWYYQQRPRAGGTVTNLSWNTNGSSVWWTSDNTGWIGDYQSVADAHPGSTSDTIRKWTALDAGTVSITGRVYKMVTSAGAGVVASVEHPIGASIWSKTIAYNNSTGVLTDSAAQLANITVSSGDSIGFVLDDNGLYDSDQTGWNPTVTNLESSTSQPTWVLNTSDTLLTLSIIGNRPAITNLEDANPATAWNWTPAPIVLPLLNTVYISSTANFPNWSYTSATVDTTSGTKVTLAFTSTSPSLTLNQCWWAHPGAGPVEESQTLTNASGSTITINDSDVISTDLTVTSDDTVTLWQFNRGNVIDGTGEGNDAGMHIGVFKTAMTAGASVGATVSNYYHSDGGPYKLGFTMLDVPTKNHGLYIGYSCDFGLINTSANAANAKLIRNLFYLYDNTKSFPLASGAAPLPLPYMLYGAYTGNTDVGSNHMKKWFWDNKITPTIKSTTNEPLVEVSTYTHTEGEANLYFADNPSMATWGIELAKQDYLWGDDQATEPFGFDWNPNQPLASYWPNGMNLGTIVHAQNLKLALYMSNTYNHADLASTAGVGSEEVALEERFNGNQLIDGSSWLGGGTSLPEDYEYWRTDIHDEVDLDYLSHLGFEQVIDYMTSNHPNFRLENASDGGTHGKSFDMAQRESVMTIADGSGPNTPSGVGYRMIWYANSYMINPVQLKSDNGEVDSTSASRNRVNFRLGFLGAWMWITDGYFFDFIPDYKTHISLYKNHQRPILRGADVYHVLPICDETHWDGAEFFNSALNKGSVILFKPNSSVTSSPQIILQGLIPTGTYSLTFQDRSSLNSSYASVSGSTLMTTGIGSFSGTANDFDSEIIWINY